ncbi:MAG: cystathionine gamma-lyase [Pseudomonadota bacterium]
MTKTHELRTMRALHAYTGQLRREDPATPPIVMTAKYKLPDPPEAQYVYGRYENPTLETAEAAIACFEDAPVVAFPSGMGAISAALFATVEQGDRILLPSDGYFAVRNLHASLLSRFGVEAEYVSTVDMTTADLSPFKVVWAETPSNPGLDVCDLSLLSEQCKAAGALLIVDNTTATPLLQAPLDLGADIAVCSDTKAMAGHSDVLFGHCATRDQNLQASIREWRTIAGSLANPFDAFLVHRGLLTLEIRLERMCSNALAAAQLFNAHEATGAVRYPGLPTDPSFELAAQQMRLPGFVVGVTFADQAQANQFIDLCPALFPSTSFGGVHSSIERRARWGDNVEEGFVRVSLGCEPTEPLLDAIESALNAL